MGCGYKCLVFCRNNDWLMENMNKGPTVPKWVLIVQPKIPQMPQTFLAQFVCPSPKVWDFRKKLSLGVRSPCFKWCKKTQKELWKFGFPFQTKLTYYIVGVILWDAISPHFSLSNSLLKLNSDRLFYVCGGPLFLNVGVFWTIRQT